MNIRQLLDQQHRPFASHPRVDRYFPAAAIEDARSRLTRAIERGDGPGLVVGSPGSGKSLLLQALAAQYHDRFDVVLLVCSQICTRRALLQAILFELGLPYNRRDEGELRLALMDQLLSDEQNPDGLLLLVDEAQALSPALLEELRMITNLVRGGMPRVRLVLAGAASLEETFTAPELETFSQRLAARCYLGPWGHDETIQYVRAQLAASGAEPDAVFATDAWEAIVEATDGVPRLVNQLCDRALMAADAEQRPQVDRHVIQTAWADLQQLPMPWETPAQSSAGESEEVVEFGSLSNEPAGEAMGEEPFTAASFTDEATTDQAEPAPEPVVEVAEVVDERDEPVSDDLAGDESPRAEECVEVAEAETPGPRVYAGDAEDDLFGGEFDEEEIVLDNFVAWDTIHLERLPQVTNNRDPQFSTRVQEAMEALDVPAPATSTSDAADEPAVTESPAMAGAEVDDSGDENWPPLRLAVVSETPTLQPVPLIKTGGPGVVTAVAAFDPVMPENDASSLSGNMFDYGATGVDADPADVAVCDRHVDESPVLVIEDDPGERRDNPPVRRQEYRQLFSRLRGG